jgi:hypothetical protein
LHLVLWWCSDLRQFPVCGVPSVFFLWPIFLWTPDFVTWGYLHGFEFLSGSVFIVVPLPEI